MNAENQRGVRIVVRNLRKSYGGRLVLKGIHFEVDRGEIFVIMGPSGSGKSVLLRHLIGLEKPDSGEILVEGESIHSPGILNRYRAAMVFQSGALLNSLTVAENVGLYLAEHRLKPPGEIRKIVIEKLRLLGLEDTADKLPAQLSGGMRKRVAVARALVMDPQLILYDEPTSELDPINAVTIGKEIVRLNRHIGATSIVVTHDRELGFGVGNRLAILLQGEIAAIGTAEEVRESRNPAVQEFLHPNFRFEPATQSIAQP